MMLADVNGGYEICAAFVPNREGFTENWQLQSEAYKAAAA